MAAAAASAAPALTLTITLSLTPTLTTHHSPFTLTLTLFLTLTLTLTVTLTRCGNGGALARHVARCTAAALEGATALESSIVVRNATIEPGRARAVAPQRAYARADGPVAAWLSGVQGGRYISTFGDLICHHFEDLDELRALASLTRLGIDNVLARIGVDRAGVRLVLTHAVRQLPATA